MQRSRRIEASPMSDPRIDVFFYGLFMDADILREAGVTPLNPRKARLDDFALRIGGRATLIPILSASAYGMLYALSQSELDRLYAGPGLEQYRPEAVRVRPLEGEATPALCYNLPEAPHPEERNPEYAARLQQTLGKLGFPPEYIASISQTSRASDHHGR
jgi:hypothetical protein